MIHDIVQNVRYLRPPETKEEERLQLERMHQWLEDLYKDRVEFTELLSLAVPPYLDRFEQPAKFLGQMTLDWFVSQQRDIDIDFRMRAFGRLSHNLRSIGSDSPFWASFKNVPRTDTVFGFDAAAVGRFLYESLYSVTETKPFYRFLICFLLGSVPEDLESASLYRKFFYLLSSYAGMQRN